MDSARRSPVAEEVTCEVHHSLAESIWIFVVETVYWKWQALPSLYTVVFTSQ